MDGDYFYTVLHRNPCFFFYLGMLYVCVGKSVSMKKSSKKRAISQEKGRHFKKGTGQHTPFFFVKLASFNGPPRAFGMTLSTPRRSSPKDTDNNVTHLRFCRTLKISRDKSEQTRGIYSAHQILLYVSNPRQEHRLRLRSHSHPKSRAPRRPEAPRPPCQRPR